MNNHDEMKFGLAKITIGEGEDAVTFDGGVEEITLTPVEDGEFDVSDFGIPFSGTISGSMTLTAMEPEEKPIRLEMRHKVTGEVVLSEMISRELSEYLQRGEMPFSLEAMQLQEKISKVSGG